MMTNIEDVTKWEMGPNTNPPTYEIPTTDPDLNPVAYQRSATAIYSQLAKTNFDKVAIFKQFVNYESKSQDGYRVLYAILAICHPKLKERSKLDQPSLKKTPNFFIYIRHLMNWIQFEKVQHRKYSNMNQLTMAMEEMENDERFEKGLNLLRIKSQMHKKFYESNPAVKFSPSLELEQLPYSVMNAYQEDERETLLEKVLQMIMRLRNRQLIVLSDKYLIIIINLIINFTKICLSLLAI